MLLAQRPQTCLKTLPRHRAPPLPTAQKVTLDGGVKTKVKVDKATKAESVSKTGSTSIKLEYKKVSWWTPKR